MLNHTNFIIHLILHQYSTIKIMISSQHFVYYESHTALPRQSSQDTLHFIYHKNKRNIFHIFSQDYTN